MFKREPRPIKTMNSNILFVQWQQPSSDTTTEICSRMHLGKNFEKQI